MENSVTSRKYACLFEIINKVHCLHAVNCIDQQERPALAT